MGWHWGILASSGGAAGAFDLLETTVLTTNTASVTFSSLGSYSNYKHLQIRFVAKATGEGNAILRFNGDTSGYASHQLFGNGSSVTSSFNTATDNIWTAILNATNWEAGVVDILDFGSASKNKTAKALASGTFSSTPYILLRSGVRLTTTAITSISLGADVGNMVSGTRVSLYGVK